MRRRKNDNRTDVLHEIREVLKKEHGIQPSSVDVYSDLHADLGLDSIELTDLSIHISEVYGVHVSDEALEGTVADVIEEIMDKD